ncbi:MAG: hypothetical protein IKU46_01760 [Peptococcaceae bacterium]|nr:hypothetical protein [Peptococcaceae bacterium]
MTINGQELNRKLAEQQDMLEAALLVQDGMAAVMDRRSCGGEQIRRFVSRIRKEMYIK